MNDTWKDLLEPQGSYEPIEAQTAISTYRQQIVFYYVDLRHAKNSEQEQLARNGIQFCVRWIEYLKGFLDENG